MLSRDHMIGTVWFTFVLIAPLVILQAWPASINIFWAFALIILIVPTISYLYIKEESNITNLEEFWIIVWTTLLIIAFEPTFLGLSIVFLVVIGVGIHHFFHELRKGYL